MRLAAAVLAALLVPSAALAQAPSDRFQIERTEEGVLRLDRVTGAVDVCTMENEGWACDSVVPPAAPPSEALADTDAWRTLQAENARLAEELQRLERRLGMIAALVADVDAAADAPPGAGDFTEDARRQIDRAVDVTDYAVRRFADLFRSFGEDGAGQ
jgi:hypothetical protein